MSTTPATGAADIAAGTQPALALHDVRAAYDRIEVIRDVSFEIAPGSVTALLGPNGAGKSTTLAVASGRLRPTTGKVLVNGTDIAGRSYDALVRSGLCSVPEGRSIFPNLSVAENIRMWTFSGGVKRSEIEERVYSRFPVLAGRRRQQAGTLSGGEQQMLAMSRALSTEPSILLLDEISMGLAPIIVAELYEHVARVSSGGTTILIVEQFANAVLAVADQALVMSQGTIVHSGSPADVRDRLADIYLHTRSS
jgi:branched-chain amino acid transport system ATP-binding protein